MKWKLVAIAAVLLLAAQANAGTINVEFDQSSYNVGDTITITVTLTIPAATDFNTGALTSYNLEPGWNSAVATVLNIPNGIGFGTSSQDGRVTQAGGTVQWTTPPNPGPPYISNCGNSGNSCIVINQNAGTAPPGVFADAAVIMGTLQLKANALGSLNPTVKSYVNQVGFLQVLAPDANLTFGTNWLANPVVVPEPGTLLLLGAGLSGLALLGRQRRS